MGTKNEYKKEITAAINAIEKLRANKSIIGVYLDETYVSKFAITLCEVRAMIEQEEELE